MSDYKPKCKKTLPIIFDDRMPVNNLTPKLVGRVNDNTEDLKNLYEETDTMQGDIDSLQDDVDGKLDVPETAGTAGQVLTSDGEGGAVWASVGSGEIVVDPTLTVEGAAADAKKTGDEITHLKQDISELDLIVNGEDRITYVANEYVVGSTGAFVPYNGWSRTDYIDLSGLTIFEYSNSGPYTDYNCFYDANKAPISFTRIQSTTGSYINIPAGAKYFAYSNPTNQIELIKWLNAPPTDGLKDKVDSLTGLVNAIEIVMPTNLVALPNQQFDIHFDNVLANRNADSVSYMESFGSAPYCMEKMTRCLNATAGTYTISLCFSDSVPDSYNYAGLPTAVSKKSATFKVIAANSGSGSNRKVLIIGDSWTANGKYPNELRTLFESSSEPMNIILLGTMGMNGQEVGAANGFHEGHGAWSSKTYCTEASYNTYTNHFYNPSTHAFDFSYYMNYCGYTGVDDVFINLGINDVETIEDFDDIIGYYNTMITSIRSYNANIRVFIGLCGLPGEYEYTVPSARYQRIKARRLAFHKRLMSEYEGRESEKFFIVPLHLSIDSKHDFPTTQMARSFRDSTLVDYCTDFTHPKDLAYNKIADVLHAYIKYVETLT